jgi:hypothetical protein
MQKVEHKAQMQDAKNVQNMLKKDGCRAQISSVGRKLLYEIHPWAGTHTKNVLSHYVQIKLFRDH